MAKYIYPMVMVVLLTGCGGFCGGIESVAYVGESAPQGQLAHPSWPHKVTLPGLTVEVSLNNALRTYQYEVMLYVIPTYLNFWDEYRHRDADALELSLLVTAQETPLTLDLHQLVLTVGQQS
jgi:hypothetical protein